MRVTLFVIAIISGMILAAPSTTYAEPADISAAKKTAQDTGLKFARCSGIYSAVSDVHFATGSPNLGQSTKETSNGAWLASAYLMFTTGTIPDWKNAMKYAETTASSEKLNRMAAFEKDTNPDKAIGELTEAMKECNRLGKLQEKLVQEARVTVYSQNHQ